MKIQRRNPKRAGADTDPISGTVVDWPSAAPSSPAASITDSNGPVLINPNIQFVFWGNAWNNADAPFSPLDVLVAASVVLSDAYMGPLAQYRGASPWIFDAQAVTPWVIDSQPANNPYNDEDIAAFALSALTTAMQGDPQATPPVLIVIGPPDIPYYLGPSQGGSTVGFHTQIALGNNEPGLFAWVNYGETIDAITAVLSHELVELFTDPWGALGPFDTRPAFFINDRAQDEIADVCNSWYGVVQGVVCQSYWSQRDNACIVPGALPPQLHSGCFVQTNQGNQGDFHLVVPYTGSGGGLIQFARSNDVSGQPWGYVAAFARDIGRFAGCALIQSNNLGALEVLANYEGDLRYYVGDVWGGWGFASTVVENGLVIGTPGFIQTSIGARGNYAVLVAQAEGAPAPLLYVPRKNDYPGQPWGPTGIAEGAVGFGSGLVFDGTGAAVALVEAQFASSSSPDTGLETVNLAVSPDLFSLHAIVRASGKLYHFYSPNGFEWHSDNAAGTAVPVALSDGTVIDGVVGDVGMVAANGVLYVYCAFADGHVQGFARGSSWNYQLAAYPWFAVDTIPFEHASNVWLMQSNYNTGGGDPNNFEAIIEDQDHDDLRHFWRPFDGGWVDGGFAGQPNMDLP